MPQGSSRFHFSTLFQLGLAALLVASLFRSGDLRVADLMQLFRGPGLWSITLAALLLIGHIILCGLRLHIYFRHVGHDLGLGSFVKLNYVGFFMKLLLPGEAAGDVVRGIFLANHMEGNRIPGLVTLVWDRIIGLVTLVVMGVVPAIALVTYAHGIERTWPLLLIAGLLAGSVVWIARDPEKISRVVRTLEIWIPLPEKLRGKHSQIRLILKTLLTDFKLNLGCFMLSIAIHATNMGAMLLLARALGDRTPMIQQAVLIPIVILAGIVPATPGNVGWNEWVSGLAWSVFGASSLGAQVFVTYRIVCLLLGFPALYWVIRSPMHRARQSGSIPAIPPAETDEAAQGPS